MSSKSKRRHQKYLERESKRKAKQDHQIKMDKIMRDGTIGEMANFLGVKLK